MEFQRFGQPPGAAFGDLRPEGLGAGGVASGRVVLGRAAADGLQPRGMRRRDGKSGDG